MKLLVSIISLIACFGSVRAQVPWPVVAAAIVQNGDTIPIIKLPEYVVFAPIIFKNAAEERKFNKLVRNVKVVYPYAKLAGIKMKEYETLLVNVSSERERRTLMQQAEQELRDQFEDDLMNFTVSQGWILLKLIDRETGNTTYQLVADFRGRFRAFFWQSFARVFSFNLKVHYDPFEEDKEIERIVRMIESGAI